MTAVFAFFNPLSVLYAALGLGFVIFVHELGHFAVAKWCGVRVERFSIGFGPVIWSYVKGETEYALSIIPFGGYVKMLGQDDVDPNQMTSEDVALDPRSYTAKSVPQRMGIISAGVIMNLITGTLFFSAALGAGIEDTPSVVGMVAPGSPAWGAGLRAGDRIDEINGRQLGWYREIIQRVILSPEELTIGGVHADGSKFSATLKPEVKPDSNRPTIGVAAAQGLTINRKPSENIGITVPGSAAAAASPSFAAGDIVRKVGETPVKFSWELEKVLAEKRDETLELVVERASESKSGAPKLVTISVPPNPVRTLGIRMDIGQISRIQEGSPADGKLQVGDKITHIISERDHTREVGRDLNPLEIPNYLAELHGEKITLQVRREVAGSDGKEVKVEIVPENRQGWVEHPLGEDSPLSAPAVGISFYVLHTVLHVDEGRRAEKLIKENDNLTKISLVLPEGGAPDGFGPDISLEFSDQKRNWPYAFWLMQQCPTREVKLTVSSASGTREVPLQSEPSEDWFSPERGLQFEPLAEIRRASSIPEALSWGVTQTTDFISDTYDTLASLVTGKIDVRLMTGPIGIAGYAIQVSSEGMAKLMYFLGFLSINLAVLNFLPIPLLDGGHMVFLCYEGIRGKPASERVLIGATYLGLLFVLGLMMFVLGLDIFHHLLNWV